MDVKESSRFAEGTAGDIHTGKSGDPLGGGFIRGRRRRRLDLEDRPDGGKGGGLLATGEPAIGPDLGEAMRQDMQHEPGDEVVNGQSHLLERVAVGSIAPVEGNGLALQGAQAMIADGNPMGIATEVIKRVLRVACRGFGINDPGRAPKIMDQAVPRGVGFEGSGRAIEPQAIRPTQGLQAGDIAGLKGLGEGLFPEQVVPVGAPPVSGGGVPRAAATTCQFGGSAFTFGSIMPARLM